MFDPSREYEDSRCVESNPCFSDKQRSEEEAIRSHAHQR